MSDGGQRLIAGLKDAIAGNFSRATIHGQTWERMDRNKRARNAVAWALGRDTPVGFHIRRIVWGRLLARTEKREGEKIRRATIYVGKP